MNEEALSADSGQAMEEAVTASTRAKPTPTLDQLQTRFRKRAEACRASGESPYAVLEAAIVDTWTAAHEHGLHDALMAVQKDPRIAGILLAPLTDEQLGIVKPPSHDAIQMTIESPGANKAMALFLVLGFTLVALMCIVGIGWNALAR